MKLWGSIGAALLVLALQSTALWCQGDSMPTGSLLFFEGDCPTGWTSPSGATSPGGRLVLQSPGEDGALVTIGVPIGNLEWPKHTHSMKSSIKVDETSYAGSSGCCQKKLGRANQRYFSGVSKSASIGLPYVQLRICQKTELEPNPTSPPSNMLFYFSNPALAGCPADTQAADYPGRVLIGLPDGGKAKQTFGDSPIKEAKKSALPGHSHSFSGKVKLTSYSVALVGGGKADDYAKAGTYSYNGQTGIGHPGFGLAFYPLCVVP